MDDEWKEINVPTVWADMWFGIKCVCGETVQIEVDDEPGNCRACGRMYRSETHTFIKEKS